MVRDETRRDTAISFKTRFLCRSLRGARELFFRELCLEPESLILG